ncbi:citrate synthase [Herbihabitans rhizosphaerae]|uniref:citrate synthase (unknown stereospecificity) n=1 Tax=Herbihabitans rhizosphaerae TaxID=1872711 RepID=A0A4Q7KEP1_9PSEU|nr:citrate synthase [Herbihabitans rhizosphaerae]RZS32725.1 citrate synthase [Herbihabitans rhizosphaerae]
MPRTPATISIDGRAHLTSAQVARYLGVKIETVYAYVSRGVLTRVRRPGNRESYFALSQVRALTGTTGPGRQRRGPGVADEIHTSITLLDHDRLYFRGTAATELAETHDFEQVCALLWESDPVTLVPDPEAAARVRASLPSTAHRLDQLKIAVILAGAGDPGKHDLTPVSVVQAATRAIGLAAGSLPGADGRTIADMLAAHFGTPAARELIRRVLVLLADHDMAMSTTAARVAASVRCDPYAVITAGLSAADSPRHGSASIAAYRLLRSAHADPHRTLGECLAGGSIPPGFGHAIYERADPRAEYLLGVLPESEHTTLIAELRTRRGWLPNVDLALAALMIEHDMPETAGELLFTISRMAGWIAHALEEYQADPRRFRLRGVYTGVRPS